MMITLRQMCEELGVSRRAVQGYENEGLITPTAKNERGYLLYDDEMRKRIGRVKQYQELGFAIKEISEIIDAPKTDLKEALVEKQRELILKLSKTNELIVIINKLIEECN